MPIDQLFTFKMGGPAGFGIKSVGLAFSKVATRSGYWTYDYSEYPSLIRGGHNMVQVTIGTEPVHFTTRHTNFLMALNQETVEFYKSELAPGSGILFDGMSGIKPESLEGVDAFDVPLVQIARDAGGEDVMRNTVAMGAALALLGGDLEIFKVLISEEFGDKKKDVIEGNHKAAQAGYDYAKEHYKDKIKEVLKKQAKVEEKIVLTANEAAAFGAVAAGLGLVAIYPMTPTSNILHILAPLQEKYGFVYKQPEDEIAAILMAIGAANTGLRTMVATSGGGFALMSEAYGLAGLTETPVVIIEGMRGGPATGLPTWTEQGDLRFVLHAHQSDFPRIVLAAGDGEEMFHLTMRAFNLAEKYQTPVVILMDKIICEDNQSYKPFEYGEYSVNRGKFVPGKQEDFKRYQLSDDGVSPRSRFGSGNFFIANADEHDEYGFASEEGENRNKQMNKRMKKLATCRAEDMQAPVLYGPEEAEVTLVSWGSNKGAILEAMKDLPNVNYLHITWMNPFPAEAVAERLNKANYLINIEQNYTAQMGGLIRERTGVAILDNLLKYDGRPIYPEEIIEKVREVTLLR